MRRWAVAVALLVLPTLAAAAFVNFESGHVRPLAFLPAPDLLFAVNTPDNRVTVFGTSAGGLARIAEVPVGLEPVAVDARVLPNGHAEAWVVNHLSDSLSVVDVDPADPARARVVRTLLVGDEPRDVVLAGPAGNRVFVTAAHRGQNRPGDAQLLVPGVPRADVWVFDADAPGAALGGTPLAIVELFGDTPRGLAASADGTTVHAAVFRSGNGTTTLNERTVSAHGGLPPAPPGATPGAPLTGLVVRHDPTTGRWEDEIGRDWAPWVPFGLPDLDVFAIDAAAPTPVVTGAVARVGTTLLALAVRPDNGRLYVANTEARNEVRFEPVLRGHLAESRITVVDGTMVTPVALNPHVDVDTVPGPPAEVEQSLAIPLGMAFSPDGQTLYLAAFGSGKIAVLDTDLLEAGDTLPRAQLDVGGGPSGLVLDAARDRLYVLNRFDGTVAIVSDASQPTRAVSATVPLGFDPSPPEVTNGRRFLYDARTTSAHGDEACASCHLFGDMDDLAWDLGDPWGAVLQIDNPTVDVAGTFGTGATYHPTKGPMLTQSLRGLLGAGPMHWRGDRSGATDGGSALDAEASFKTFNVAFTGLLGRATELDDADMQAFTDFVLTLRYPPNPIRPLDGPTPEQAAGESVFENAPSDGGTPCGGCHPLPLGTGGRVGVAFPFFQPIKVPHLRSVYQKVGRFGLVQENDHGLTPYTVADQVRGFGLEFNGSLASVFDFHGPQFGLTPVERDQVSAFVLAFDTGLAPAVGQQVTATAATLADPAVAARIALLVGRDDARDCDLVVKGLAGTEERGWLHVGAGFFMSDRQAEGLVDEATVRAQAAVTGRERTYTCVPPGSGLRTGIDRDADTVADGDERDAGSDPAASASLPPGLATVPIQTTKLLLKDRTGPPPNPAFRKITFKSRTRIDPPANRIVPPAIGSAGDPTLTGATLLVYNAAGSGRAVVLPLAPAGWTPLGSADNHKGWRFRADTTDAPIASVRVGRDRLVISGGRSRWRYTLDASSQGAVAVRLRLGTGVEWCASAPGRLGRDEVDRFVAVPKTPAPAECPPL
jgi:DNA-binding beta-propeller fold protein YncE